MRFSLSRLWHAVHARPVCDFSNALRLEIDRRQRGERPASARRSGAHLSFRCKMHKGLTMKRLKQMGINSIVISATLANSAMNGVEIGRADPRQVAVPNTVAAKKAAAAQKQAQKQQQVKAARANRQAQRLLA